MKRTLTGSLLALLLGTATAQAADSVPQRSAAPPPMVESGWRFQITPYGWLPTIGGTVRPAPGLPTFEKTLSPGDVLERLNGAIFLTGTARYGRLMFYGDLTWAQISETALAIVPGIGIPVRVKGTVTQGSLTLGGGYSVIDTPAFVLDALAGARIMHIEADVEAQAFLAPNFAIGAAGGVDKTWVDPILGARFRWQFAPDWSLIGYGDVGGFDVGSKLTWQVVGTVNYRMTENLYLSAGWRHMYFDYRERGQIIETDMSGPIFGATLRF